jgi:hypothetical protein
VLDFAWRSKCNIFISGLIAGHMPFLLDRLAFDHGH